MISVRAALFRTCLKLAYWGMRVVWFLTRRPHTAGAVAVWSGDRLLTIRESYRNCFSIPGGGVKGEEEPIQAAIRELREEVGIAAKPEDLRPVLISYTSWEDRQDAVHVFEYRPPREAEVTIDNREIIWADYCLPSRLRERPVSPHLDDYLRQVREKAGS
jgi:8-oxo-dGTP pyrophosphatase MutT (NUDIX family)